MRFFRRANLRRSAVRPGVKDSPEGGAATDVPSASVDYHTFDGRTEALIPWPGRRVTLLVNPRVARHPEVMSRILGALDAAHDYYAVTVGRLPSVDRSLNGRGVIAEVISTCGAGCSLLGATGMEIMRPYFQVLYEGVDRRQTFDQVLFYEFGRNFWFWSDQLAFHAPDDDPVVTGFAVWMRFRAMAAARVAGAAFGDLPFPAFLAEVEGLIGGYEANPTMTFAHTLARNRSPGRLGGTDFWASIMMQLARRHGDQEFVSRFWQLASRAPRARNTVEAVTNWVRVASQAARVDLSPVFHDRWGFPRPDGSVRPRPPAASVPEPSVSD